ncbi:hypothetical protein [Streptomyces gelaticus]|uniref:hypothetical protein n=1 Tax=Streptomyces gelaticus TaxID=285446 RepID=UPI001E2C45B1|nr:hypothetical protein [Streptomyces gelaticus]
MPSTTPYATYDPESDTVRIGRHDLERLLLEFRSLVSQQAPGSWEHMSDYVLSFERLAGAVGAAAEARQGTAGRALTSGCAAPPPKPCTPGRMVLPTGEVRRSRGTYRVTAPPPPVPPRTCRCRCAASTGQRGKAGA